MTAAIREISWHGHRVAYRREGTGPVVLLVHGIAGSLRTWEPVWPHLAGRCDLVAPDLLGHGQSAKPRGDYSLGAYATGLRDLLELLEAPSATVVGHSLGGGVAMQFAYQYPQYCDRLVLVASGGLGRSVTPLLRAATLPGSGAVVSLMTQERLHGALAPVVRFVTSLPGMAPSAGALEVRDSLTSLRDRAARTAFLHTVRGVLDVGGQRIDATDRLYLAGDMPMLIVWGARDRFIPVEHAYRAAALVPQARLEVFPRAGHFPHRDEPERFAGVLADFLATTQPARLTPAAVRDRVRSSAPAG